MQAIVFDRVGSPLQVLEPRQIPIPEPRDGEVLLRMVAAPISPGDFLFIENLYPEPKKPKLPGQIAGNHGVGIVEKAGGRTGITPGSRVAFSYEGSWAEYAVIPAEWLMPLPGDYPPELGSQFFNLITAWDLLQASGAGRDDWLAVTAGNATVSLMLLQFAKARGIKVLPIIRHRRRDLIRLGAADVIELPSGPADDLHDRVMNATDGRGLKALVDNVGGPDTGTLIRGMAFGGQVVINGGMSPDRFTLHNFDVLLNGIEIRSHVYRYLLRPPHPDELPELAKIARLSEGFEVPVGGRDRLADFRTAVRETLERPGLGKHFFDFGAAT